MAVVQPETPAKLAFRIEGHTFASQEDFLEWHRKTASVARQLSDSLELPEPPGPTADTAVEVPIATKTVEKVQVIRLEDCKSRKVASADSAMVGLGILAGLGVLVAGSYLAYRMGQRSSSRTPDGYPRPHDESWYTGDLGPMDVALAGGEVIVL